MYKSLCFLLAVLMPLICFNGQDDDLQKRKIRILGIKPTKESLERKTRSETILKKEGVPFVSHLPVIENESGTKMRSAEAVARRAIALCLVAVKGEGLEQKKVIGFLKRYDIEKDLTPKERVFVFNENPSQQDRVQFSWRYEGYWMMLWALGYVDNLDRPDHLCDVSKAVGILVDMNAAQFMAKSKLRSASEILDQADLIYRYHWAVVDARINGKKPPANLDPGVVYERHYALNWLIGYMDQDWDNISTDT